MKDVKVTTKITTKDHNTASDYITSQSSIEKLNTDETISRIIKLNEGLTKFWSQADGWAPVEAAELLSKSRLDWQVSLSHCLKKLPSKWSSNDESGNLILGWVNLGSLVEGTLKLFLSVFYNDYKNDVNAIIKRNRLQDPDGLLLEPLKQFFRKKIWDKDWDDWISLVQQRRNAIHAFKSREIGTKEELLKEISKYLDLLRYINYRLPYPDDTYMPREV
ncbi:MAG: hypothetical protein ACUZ8E_05435 [Candidatus Anammoxibacter sp.]